MSDQLQKFMFNAAPVRGEIVSLRNTWQEVLARRDYPAPVRTVLGEMMAACALLSANLKFDGTLIMQIFGDGPVKMLVVQCSSSLAMRATAKFSAELEAEARPYRIRSVTHSFVGKRKIGRNEPCPCGSGKKYKKCCLQ